MPTPKGTYTRTAGQSQLCRSGARPLRYEQASEEFARGRWCGKRLPPCPGFRSCFKRSHDEFPGPRLRMGLPHKECQHADRVPKEVKDREDRVGLVPSSVAELVHHGHQVIVEKGVG